jgi:hypothetical protein
MHLQPRNLKEDYKHTFLASLTRSDDSQGLASLPPSHWLSQAEPQGEEKKSPGHPDSALTNSFSSLYQFP